MRTVEEIVADVQAATSTNDIDALLTLSKELDQFDTPQTKAVALRARGWASYLRGGYDDALQCFNQALELFTSLNDRIGVARAVGNIATVQSDRGDYAEALSSYRSALAVFQELDNLQGIAAATGNIGIVLDRSGEYTDALAHYERARVLFEQLRDQRGVSIQLGNIGNVYSCIGDFAAALESYHRSLSIKTTSGDSIGMAYSLGNIGNVYMVTADYPSALEYYQNALAIHEEIGNRGGIATVTGNIGLVHLHTGDYSESLVHLQAALLRHEELGDRRGVARVNGNIGIALLHNGELESALTHFKRTLAIYEELEDVSGIAAVTGSILASYLEMGSDVEASEMLSTMDALQIDDPDVRATRELHRATLQERSNDLDRAVVTLQHALAAAAKHNLRSRVAEIHLMLRELAQKQNDLAGYVEHNNEYARINEEVNGKETATKLAMQAKQREIDAEQREHRKQLAVLYSALPKHIADRVASGEVVNDQFDHVTVMFLDVVGFTSHSDSLEANLVVNLLQEIFTAFDAICAKHEMMKIKTIGDSYMAVAFPHESLTTEERAANTAIAMQALSFTWPNGDPVEFRFGIHSGPVVAGILGTERLQYDVWGDTVNTASRMESSGEAGRIHVSEAFASSLPHPVASGDTPLHEGEGQASSSRSVSEGVVRKRGELEIKGKGTMTTYWLEGA